jgi:hypothetical protein
MVKRVLMVAFHFPPQQGSSGILRTLKFSRYLPENGWQPIVLTANARAYEKIDTNSLTNVPDDIAVHRALRLMRRATLPSKAAIRDSVPCLIAGRHGGGAPCRWACISFASIAPTQSGRHIRSPRRI